MSAEDALTHRVFERASAAPEGLMIECFTLCCSQRQPVITAVKILQELA